MPVQQAGKYTGSFIDLVRSLYERPSVERSDPAAIASLHYGRGQSAGSAILSYSGQRDLLVSRRRFRQVDLARRHMAFQRRSSAPARGKAGMCGSCLPSRFLHFWRRGWGAYLVTEAMEQNRAGRRLWQFDRAAPATQSSLERQQSVRRCEFRTSCRSMSFPFDTPTHDTCGSDSGCRGSRTARTGNGVCACRSITTMVGNAGAARSDAGALPTYPPATALANASRGVR